MAGTLHERLIRFTYPGIFPLGWLVNALATSDNNPATNETLSKVREVSNETSLTLLDAHTHKLPFDMMCAAMLLLRNSDINQVAIPVAAYLYYQNKLHKNFFKPLSEVEGMQVYPVFRVEELGRTSRIVQDNSGLSESEKKDRNSEYMTAINEMQGQPHTLGVIAPYGSRRTFGDSSKIRNGVIEVVQNDQPVIQSKAKWQRFPRPAVKVSLSEIKTYSNNSPPDTIKHDITDSFKKL